jgi:Raf kinase inhibitor-like YbhB/YbcL family protein
MQITSPVFENQQTIPQQYTCEGEGSMPPLEISDVPEAARALALIVDDPDAPVGLFTHWLIWNISPSTTKLEGLVEGAKQGKNSTGQIGWIAPCPPAGTGVHRYRFQLYALSQELDLPEGAGREELEKAIEKVDINRAELVGKYSNSQKQ